GSLSVPSVRVKRKPDARNACGSAKARNVRFCWIRGQRIVRACFRNLTPGAGPLTASDDQEGRKKGRPAGRGAPRDRHGRRGISNARGSEGPPAAAAGTGRGRERRKDAGPSGRECARRATS